jgi:DNA-binding transcriptional ArsR family regulator
VPPDTTSFFAVLADPTRVRLLEVLATQTGDHALCVGALAARLAVSQPAVSQHLRVLRSLGLVRAERRGLRVHYLLDRQRFGEWRRAADEFFDDVTAEREPSSGCPCAVADAARPAQGKVVSG